MPRAVKTSVVVPAGVDVKINGQIITIKGRNGELTCTLNGAVEVKHTGSTLAFGPHDGYADDWAQAGIARALLSSMVIDVTEGFTKKLQLVDVGYRAAVRGSVINLSLGFSHPVDRQLSVGITIGCPTQTEVALEGAGEQVIGQVAADLCTYHRPELYKGKDVRYADEVVCTKETRKKWGNTMDKKSVRIRRATRAHRKLQELGTTCLVAHRTPHYIYVRTIASNGSEVLVAASTVEKTIAERLKYTGNEDAATVVGKVVAERVLEKGIKDVSPNHSGFQYYGRVQTLADVAREAGLQS